MTDIVITYVNGEDPKWMDDYKDCFNDKPNNSRFFDWRFLKYIFRGIDKNLPWVNKVHLVVSRDSQVPEWINRDVVNVVTHDMIIPKEYLPTFNSCTIEMFLQNIPNLSEQYLYINDDVIPLNPSQEVDYFENGIAKMNLMRKKSSSPNVFLNQCINSTNLAYEGMGMRGLDGQYFRPNHSCTCFLKSYSQKLFDSQQDKIYKVLSKKRTVHNYNQYAFSIYLKLVHKLTESKLKHDYVNIKDGISTIQHKILNKSNQWLCINDTATPSTTNRPNMRSKITNLLEHRFNDISKYEQVAKKVVESQSVEDPIDFIFPYVTMSDPEWLKLYNQYCPKINNDWNKWSSGEERFRDCNLLQYMFRSVAQNMPWINKMHMIVSSESQVPEWVNRDTVNIVLHKDFIPQEHLPTFNSTTIEMFIPLITELSNRFIYSNDDVYITQPLKPRHFFKDNIPIFHLSKRVFKSGALGDPIRRNALKISGSNEYNKYIYDTQHICLPYVKSNMLKLYKKNKDIINKSCSRFREQINSNQYMYLFYQAFKASYIDRSMSRLSTWLDERHQKAYKQNYKLFSVCCLNDSNNSRPEDIKYVTKVLSNMFPKKCKYEK